MKARIRLHNPGGWWFTTGVKWRHVLGTQYMTDVMELCLALDRLNR